MDIPNLVTKRTYVGLFMITLATLMYETLLTRIFSVTMWHHFAFMAVSLALFGMTVGAIIVYLLPAYFTQERVKYHLALSSLLFAVTSVVSFLTHLSVPFVTDPSIVKLFSIVLTFGVLALPFVFSGMSVCLALTKFTPGVSKLYAADLAGAAVGCVLFIYVLGLTDGPTAVLVAAFLASLGALCFASQAGSKRLTRNTVVYGILLAIFIVVNALLSTKQIAPLRLVWVKGKLEPRLLYEKWNSFSRIRVYGNQDELREPIGWGLSQACSEHQVRQLGMDIDAGASTVLTEFDGNLENLDYLKCDVTNVAYYLKRDAQVLIVGAGGGRDILSALVFGQKSVLGVEINEHIVNATNQRFGDFTGHLDRHPQVTWVTDEARSYITRSTDRFDIIQLSLVDTWAATASGAYVLTENSLYTVEAWKIFLDHLNPDGILTVSRWYHEDKPGEMYRLTSLASTALKRQGVENPRQHIVIVRNMEPKGSEEEHVGVGTMLLSLKPFSDDDLDILQAVADKLQFELVFSRRVAVDPYLAAIASAQPSDALAAKLHMNIAAPTDDDPFFFYMLRLQDLFNPKSWGLVARGTENAVFVLASLFLLVVILTLLSIIFPLRRTIQTSSLKDYAPLLTFFCCIGLGYILVEISQMQRLAVFLGHPTYSLSVVLFTLLLSSGLGSHSTSRVAAYGLMRSAVIRLSLLLLALLILGILGPYVISTFQGQGTVARIALVAAMLFPPALFMGMAFPLGMKVASTQSAAITPWLWGINGATSVCASVLSIVIALNSGISTAFWAGFLCYVVAFVALVWANRKG